MTNLFLLLATGLLLPVICPAQAAPSKRSSTIGIHFLLNDFESATAIRSTSFAVAVREHRFARIENMPPGLALSYSSGLSPHVDFTSMLAGSFLSYPSAVRQRPRNEALLLEGDVAVRGKMFTDKYWLVPYLLAGAGVSKFKGYWGAYIPLGAGIQLSFFGEAYLQINSQYRVGITEEAGYHFVHSIGLVGNISEK